MKHRFSYMMSGFWLAITVGSVVVGKPGAVAMNALISVLIFLFAYANEKNP